MLIRLITSSYVRLLELSLWTSLAFAAIVGYHLAVPLIGLFGMVFTNELAGKLVGAVVLTTLMFLSLAAAVGPILVVIDIRQSLRRIEARRDRDDALTAAPFERREPSI
jgi:hypothetical protein